jgi:hypothetical protein
VLSALVRSQVAAAAGTAVFRNPLVAGADTPIRSDGCGGVRDFDFLFGRWRVHNERLRERLAGSTDWQCFDAIAECRPILGGAGNIDEFVTDEFEPTVFFGMTLRLFDRATQRWSIYWASDRSGRLEPPVIGGFEEGIGRFDGDDVHDGRPVRVRFVWSVPGPDRAHGEQAHWEQAFSADGGRTWETNWRMHFTRLAAEAPLSADAS